MELAAQTRKTTRKARPTGHCAVEYSKDTVKGRILSSTSQHVLSIVALIVEASKVISFGAEMASKVRHLQRRGIEYQKLSPTTDFNNFLTGGDS